MATYVCYGLTLRSAIELPELDANRADDVADELADVVIELGEVGESPSSAVGVEAGIWRDESSCGVAVSDVARFAAHEGRRIVVEPAAGAADRDVRLFLLGTVMGAIMMQRGHLVLHGNAIRVDDACAVVVGHSGSGKSTLAAEFVQRGLDVLSDDVVPVDSAGRGLAGYPRIKLWEDALARIGMTSDGLEPVRTAAPKFNVPIARSEFGALALRWVYALETQDGPGLDIVPVAGIRKFELLSEHTYRPQLLFDRASTWQHAQQCAALGARARVARVRRPAATMTPAATADAVLADIAAHPG